MNIMKQIKEWQEIGRLEIIKIKAQTKKETLDWVKLQIESIINNFSTGDRFLEMQGKKEVLSELNKKIDEELKIIEVKNDK